jgi:hypothetical protein
MRTIVFDCVSNDKDDDMTSIGLITEYIKGNSQYRERVNLVMATTDDQLAEELEPGAQYIVTFTKKTSIVKGDTGDIVHLEEKS